MNSTVFGASHQESRVLAHAEKVVFLDVKSQECGWEAGVIFSSANSSLPLLSPLPMYRRV